MAQRDEIVVDEEKGPKAILLDEARGPEVEAESEEEVAEVEAPADEDPLAALRAEIAEREKAIRREIAKERERRRKAVRKSEVLERQVQELMQTRAVPEVPERVKLPLDEDGNVLLTRETVEQLRPKTPSPTVARPDSDALERGRDSFVRMKESLIDEDPEYDKIFQRLERCTVDLVRGLQEAQQDGETLATPDDVVEYLEGSEMGTELRARYPEVEDFEDLVRAISSNRAARKLAQKVRAAQGKKSNGAAKKEEAAAGDLTSTARARIREKANQTSRARASTAMEGGISIEDVAKLDPEALLALSPAQREKLKKELAKAF